MEEFISEPLTALTGPFDAAAMARGEPGLPVGFRWRGREYRIARQLGAWKKSEPEMGTGRLYLRRHYFRLKMDDGAEWEVYFTRQGPPRSSPRAAKQRWFLYTVRS